MKLINDKIEVLETQINAIDFTEIDERLKDLAIQSQTCQTIRNDLVKQQRTLQAEVDFLRACLKKINKRKDKQNEKRINSISDFNGIRHLIRSNNWMAQERV